MCEIVYPYSYLGRYGRSQTVLVQNAGDDEFFLPSDTWFFWDQMFGEKYLGKLPFYRGYVIKLTEASLGWESRERYRALFYLMMTKKDLSKQESQWSWFKVGFYDYALSLATLSYS